MINIPFTRFKPTRYTLCRKAFNEMEIQFILLEVANGMRDELIGATITNKRTDQQATIRKGGVLSADILDKRNTYIAIERSRYARKRQVAEEMKKHPKDLQFLDTNYKTNFKELVQKLTCEDKEHHIKT